MSETKVEFKKYVPYVLNFEHINGVEFFLKLSESESKRVNFNDLIKFFKNKKILESLRVAFFNEWDVRCEDNDYTIICDNLIARQILSVMLNLQSQNKPMYCYWYFYDLDSCTDTPQFQHLFFLGRENKILSESVTLSTSWLNQCDSNLLIDDSISKYSSLWTNDWENQEATTHWYYQEFYQSTVTGQIQKIKENLQSRDLLETFNESNNLPNQFELQRSIDEKLSSIDKNLGRILIGLIVVFVFFLFR